MVTVLFKLNNKRTRFFYQGALIQTLFVCKSNELMKHEKNFVLVCDVKIGIYVLLTRIYFLNLFNMVSSIDTKGKKDDLECKRFNYSRKYI